MKLNKLIILFLCVIAASSCQEEYEVPMVPGNEVAGEWYVTYTVGGVDIYGVGHTSMLTSNTAAGTGDSILVTDVGHFWDFTAKSIASPSSMSFGSADSTMNMAYPVNMVINSGKIIPDGGKSKTGVTVDSIYFEIGFGDDANTFVASGHRRTGFEEDDY